MPGAPDGLKLLKDYSDGGYSDFEYVPDASELDLEIDRGLLFLMAFWSGPAVVGFKRICGSLLAHELPCDFVFRVLDWDGATQFLEPLSRHDLIIGGNAEAFWFRQGEIVASTIVETATPERVREIVVHIAEP